jgi:hypothetical protein
MTTPIMPHVCEGNATALVATNAKQEYRGPDMSRCWLVSSHRHSRLRKRGHERQAPSAHSQLGVRSLGPIAPGHRRVPLRDRRQTAWDHELAHE